MTKLFPNYYIYAPAAAHLIRKESLHAAGIHVLLQCRAWASVLVSLAPRIWHLE